MMRQYELVDRVLAYDPTADEALLNRAYVYGTKKHGTQKRASGDPYFSHPIEVAGILTELKLDAMTIATALLHDTIEDTDATAEEISELFGTEIAALVDGVTKLSRLELTSEHAKQAENFRKFLVAMANDIRVLLVKLADRLHNMRTLHFIPSKEKRLHIAQETMDIYAPLAGRMGIQEIREELEDLSFKEINPEAREAIITRLSEFREESKATVDRIAEALRQRLADAGLEAEIAGRVKRPFSVWRKIEHRSISLEQLSDIFGFRVIVNDIPACYQALGVLHAAWRSVPGRFKDYISVPKNNGYRSIHSTIVGPEKKRVEIQIRTRKMHEVAEFGIAAHWLYKEGVGGAENSEEFANTFQWLRQLVEMLEHGSTPEEFLEHTKLQLFSDQVFCFTPKGMLINLPSGATPIDFAYAVHTDIGDNCVGCRINGRHSPLRTVLQNGDEVEIICSKAQRPIPSWEGMVATGKARSAIRRSLRLSKQEEFKRLGREIIKNTFVAAGKRTGDKMLERALGPLNKADLGSLYMSVGDGTLTSEAVLAAVYPKAVVTSKKGKGAKADKAAGGQKKPSVIGVSARAAGQAIRYAEETFPLPGERIVGIIMPGEGITVYPIDSPSLAEFDGKPECWIDLTWEIDPERTERFLSRLYITAANEVGALAAIASLIADYDGNIENLFMSQRDMDFYDLHLDIEVRDVKHLTQIISALRGLSVINAVHKVRS